jgi:hypothetical protein
MRVTSCVLLLSLLFSIGCSSSYEVSSSPNADSSFNAFNVEASDRSATIVFQDGRELGVRDIIASPDSTCFLNEKTDAITVVPTHTIQKVVFKKRFAGFLEGFWIGALVGVPAGVGLVVFGMPKGEGESNVIAAVFVGGLVGGLIGGISGFVIGHSYEYQFPVSVDSTKK